MNFKKYYISLLFAVILLNGCNDSLNKNVPSKNDDEKKINPYAGTGKETSPSDISGAWLTQCQIEKLGKANSSNKDVLYCRSADRSNQKSKPGSINFFDSNNKNVTAKILPVSDDSYFSGKYEIDPEVAKTYSSEKSKIENIDYRIIDISTFKWPGSAVVNDKQFLFISQFVNGLAPIIPYDTMFCNADGTLRSAMAFTIAGLAIPSPSSPDPNAPLDPISITPATISGDACYGSISQSSGSSNPFKGFGLPQAKNSDVSNNLVVTGATGCAVALIYQVDRIAKSFTNPKFVILDKSQVKEEMKNQNDITLNRLRSAAYASQCQSDPFGFINSFFR